MKCEVFISHKIANDLRVWHDLDFKFMVPGWKNSKFVNDPYLVLKKNHCKFLLYTNIASDIKVCHDFVPSSFGQV